MSDYAHGYDDLTTDELMEKVRKGWRSGGDETNCGSGSTWENSAWVRTVLPEVVRDWNIDLIADVGCGDLNWVSKMQWGKEVHYVPFDINPVSEGINPLDACVAVLPTAYDLILCRHVLNHLSIRMASDAIENFRESGSTFLLMTNCENQRNYWDHYDFKPFQQPIMVRPDCQHWDLELYEL